MVIFHVFHALSAFKNILRPFLGITHHYSYSIHPLLLVILAILEFSHVGLRDDKTSKKTYLDIKPLIGGYIIIHIYICLHVYIYIYTPETYPVSGGGGGCCCCCFH